MSFLTNKLFLLVGDEFGNLVFARRELLLVVREIANDEFSFTGVQFELFHHLFEQRDGVQSVLVVLSDELTGTRHYHVGDFLVILLPFMERGPEIASLIRVTRGSFAQ